jgi:hypothetical protein
VPKLALAASDLATTWTAGRRTYCLRCLHPIADDAETRVEGMSPLASRDECVIFKICSVLQEGQDAGVHGPSPAPDA